jgi:glycosyltransferase involved in cell wall biosynthesis
MPDHPRIAIVSPFLDKKHGTERRVTELVGRLAEDYGYEIHIYSQRVEDLVGVQIYYYRCAERVSADTEMGKIWWHRVPQIVGPGLVRYLWWFIANQLCRWWDRRVHGLTYDMVYTPGINCFDADAISVHIVFAQFYRQVKDDLTFCRNPVHFWPWLIHRQLSYRLMMILERMIYTRRSVFLTVIARKVTVDLQQFYHQQIDLPVVYLGIDQQQFSSDIRSQLRSTARSLLGISSETFALLLVGNDWKNKGLPCLLQAVGQLHNLNLQLLIVGRDQTAPYQTFIDQYNLRSRVQFLPPRPDVQFYYAAADTYIAPSREDAFAQPPIEAMACGLPVIVSSHAGASELITDGVDGLILEDPTDSQTLAELIQRLYKDAHLRQQLSNSAIKTTQQYTWDRNAMKMHMVFQQVMLRKRRLSSGIQH